MRQSTTEGSSRPIRIAASILSADFGALGDAAAVVEAAEADWLHIDVMDGHFVPNFTFGPPMVAALRRRTGLFRDAHLMVERPESLLRDYVEAGAQSITIHAEATHHLHRTLGWLREMGVKAGVALNPATPLAAVENVLPNLDLLLVMTVNPGFGGQKFILGMLPKIRRARQMLDEAGVDTVLQVDGGIDTRTIRTVAEAGAEVAVIGSALFQHEEGVAAAVRALRAAAQPETG